MRIHLYAALLAEYRAEPPVDDAAHFLANQLLSMIEDPGLWSIDDRGSWIEIVREDEEELERLRQFADTFGGG